MTRLPCLVSFALSFATHAPTSSGVTFTDEIDGSPGLMSVLPSGFLPLPHCGRSSANFSCCANCPFGNEQLDVSFATQPMIGTVTAARPPFSTTLPRNLSVESISWFSQNQSRAELHALPSFAL